MKTQAQYITSYTNCPHCDSTDVDCAPGAPPESDADWMSQLVHCNTCGAEWTDNYRLVGYTMKYVPPIQLEARWVRIAGTFDDNGIQNIEPASERDVVLGNAFIGLYQRHSGSAEWEWISDYKNADELYSYTGINDNRIKLLGGRGG